MLLSWQELKVPQAYTILQQIMSHGKVIKNRSLEQAHSLKVYIIFLLLSLYYCLLFVFTLFFFLLQGWGGGKAFVSLVLVCVFWEMSVCTMWNSSSNTVFKPIFHHRDPLHWRLNLHRISQSGAHILDMHFISWAQNCHLSRVKWSDTPPPHHLNVCRCDGYIHFKKRCSIRV